MLLYAEDNCMVNFVEIIHDCVPRIVGLTLMFERNDYDESDLVYLKVKNLMLISVIYIELYHVIQNFGENFVNCKVQLKFQNFLS